MEDLGEDVNFGFLNRSEWVEDVILERQGNSVLERVGDGVLDLEGLGLVTYVLRPPDEPVLPEEPSDDEPPRAEPLEEPDEPPPLPPPPPPLRFSSSE